MAFRSALFLLGLAAVVAVEPPPPVPGPPLLATGGVLRAEEIAFLRRLNRPPRSRAVVVHDADAPVVSPEASASRREAGPLTPAPVRTPWEMAPVPVPAAWTAAQWQALLVSLRLPGVMPGEVATLQQLAEVQARLDAEATALLLLLMESVE